MFKANLSKASVLTLYLLPGMMINLRSKLFNELRPGARVVSHDYHFGGESVGRVTRLVWIARQDHFLVGE